MISKKVLISFIKKFPVKRAPKDHLPLKMMSKATHFDELDEPPSFGLVNLRL